MKQLALFVIGLIIVPYILLLGKLTYYIIDNPFREWWITIMWVLALPITVLIIAGMKGCKNER